MKKLILNIALKFLTPDLIAEFVAKIVVKLLRWANEQKTWDNAKNIMDYLSKLCKLFNEVYEDDELTDEDEKKIQTAILNLTDEETIKNILEKIK